MSDSAERVLAILGTVTIDRNRPTSKLKAAERQRIVTALEELLTELESKASATASATKPMWNGFSRDGGSVIRADSKGEVITAWVLREGYGNIQDNIKSITFRDPDSNQVLYYSSVVPTASGLKELIIIHDSKRDAVDFEIPVEETEGDEEETAEEGSENE